MITIKIIVFWIYLVISSIIKGDNDCNNQYINRNGQETLHLLGTNTPITPGADIGFDGYSCFNADLFKLNGCKIGSIFHCGLFGEQNECGDQLADARDLYVLNNGDRIKFGSDPNAAASVHPLLDGSAGADIWDLVTQLFATQDNWIEGTGRYKHVEGQRSLRGYISIHGDGTGSIDEYHFLELRCSKCGDDDSDDRSDSSDDNQGFKAFFDANHMDNSYFSTHSDTDINYNIMMNLFALIIVIMLLSVIFCFCYHRQNSKKINNQLPGGSNRINSLS